MDPPGPFETHSKKAYFNVTFPEKDWTPEHVAEHIGKLARPKRILWSDDLPKTRSGKIMRRLLRDIADGRALGDVTTLRDPTVMAVLEQKISAAQAQED